MKHVVFLFLIALVITSVSHRLLAQTQAWQTEVLLTWQAKKENVQGPKTLPKMKIYQAAKRAFSKAQRQGLVKNRKLTLIDFSRPSNVPRLWVIDMKSRSIIAQALVAHGEGSGEGKYAKRFSNISGSHQSSLGTYIVGKSYYGTFGYAAFVRGLEPGLNDKAGPRKIRIHQLFNMMNKRFNPRYPWSDVINTYGCFGISDGKMQAIENGQSVESLVGRDYASTIINMIRGGSVLVAYHPDIAGKSSYLRIPRHSKGDKAKKNAQSKTSFGNM